MNKSALQMLAVLIIVVLVFLAGMMYSSDDSASPDPDTPAVSDGGSDTPARSARPGGSGGTDALSVRDTDAPRGNGPYLLIEYSDYECPFCKRFHPTVRTLVDGGEVTWIYRHLPLPFHETADEGARIAECVRIHEGDRAFWTYTDAVFDSETPDLELYRSLGSDAGLSPSQIDACLETGSDADAVVRMHAADAQLFGINGTPGSFVVDPKTGDFRRIPGAFPLEGEGEQPGVRDILESLKQGT